MPIFLVTLVMETTFWDRSLIDLLRLGYTSSTIRVVDAPLQPKLNSFYPALKLLVLRRSDFNTTHITINRIDIDNLVKYQGDMAEYPTVFYFYGFLDTPLKIDTTGVFRTTSASIILWSYFQRMYLADITLKGQGITAPTSLYWNVIVIDWSAYNTDYSQTLINMPGIAVVIGDLLFTMSQNSRNPLDLSKWHLVGHSLGAHMAGITAQRIKERSGRVVIPRVTGLDPAGPVIEFEVVRNFYPRLNKDCGIIN